MVYLIPLAVDFLIEFIRWKRDGCSLKSFLGSELMPFTQIMIRIPIVFLFLSAIVISLVYITGGLDLVIIFVHSITKTFQ